MRQLTLLFTLEVLPISFPILLNTTTRTQDLLQPGAAFTVVNEWIGIEGYQTRRHTRKRAEPHNLALAKIAGRASPVDVHKHIKRSGYTPGSLRELGLLFQTHPTVLADRNIREIVATATTCGDCCMSASRCTGQDRLKTFLGYCYNFSLKRPTKTAYLIWAP